jgi:hypothetical protein
MLTNVAVWGLVVLDKTDFMMICLTLKEKKLISLGVVNE